MEEMLLDCSSENTSAGFRLHRFEVLNWGTFDHKIWDVAPNGKSSLVTGDIGSGKTTLVDGIATLLVPPGKIRYNRTASSETGSAKERSPYSYVRGLYKKKRGDDSGKGEAVYLRNENIYSVLLANFHNEGINQCVSLAQVLYIRNHKVETFHVVSTEPLSILKDFTEFGTDIRDLKKRLNKLSHTETHDDFTAYSDKFRKLFGGLSREAFLLFRDTISTKEIENLTSFVQLLMLEKPEKIDETITDLYNNFDNLNHAYNAVSKAKEQIEMLRPIMAGGERFREQAQASAEAILNRKAIPSYFAQFVKTMQEKEISSTESDIEKNSDRIKAIKESLAKSRKSEEALKRNIYAAGGGDIEKLSDQIANLEEQCERKQVTWSNYQGSLKEASLGMVSTEAEFFTVRTQAAKLLVEAEDRRSVNDKMLYDEKRTLEEVSTRLVAVGKEIDSLKKRKSNINVKNLEIRAGICAALKIDEEKLPFVGELVKVSDADKEWQGAIERVLHNFGLSILVSDALYSRVSDYVDKTNLRGRIVYFRVRKDDGKKPLRETEPDSLYRKLEVRHDSEFSEYLCNKLTDQFSGYICCRTMEEFRKYPMAVTLQGQIKSGGQRHEKDDRRDINDSREYILGWNNKEKIRTLEKELDQLFAIKKVHDDEIQRIGKEIAGLVTRRDNLKRLENFSSYSDVDWESVAKDIAVKREKMREIRESSNVIGTLQKQLDDVVINIRQEETALEAANRKDGELGNRLASLKASREKAIERIDVGYEPCRPQLDELAREHLPTTRYTLENSDRLEKALADKLDATIRQLEQQIRNLREHIVSLMTTYKGKYSAETSEFNAAIDSLEEFLRILNKLEDEDLPRHQATFRTMLREQTINGIALLSTELENSKNDITDRIGRINTSLCEIEYNPGRYIELVPENRFDKDIVEFKAMIKDCLAGALGDDDKYNEERFCKVKDIVEKLRADTVWAKKVTDVRNWFTFSARETVREDGSEWETYDDTTGKSGGQKEKLAYTILASALAYQFGLSWGEKQSRSFRFIAVDEAFGRMSEESTRYGLELLKKLNLQFLIVTPLQKINIIENYVQSIHYVHNYEGKNSVIRNMTIEEYRAKKDEFLKESRLLESEHDDNSD